MALTQEQEKLQKLFETYIRETDQQNVKISKKIRQQLQKTNIGFVINKYDFTLLHFAVHQRELYLVKLLCDDDKCQDIINNETSSEETAVQLALMDGEGGGFEQVDVDIFKRLISAGAAYSLGEIYVDLKNRLENGDDAKKALLRDALGFIMQYGPKKLKKQDNNFLDVYAYPESQKALAQKKEYLRQQKVTERFFHVGINLKKGKPSAAFYGEMCTAIDMKWPVDLDGYSARAVVIAVSKLLQRDQAFPSVTFKLGNTLLKCVKANEDRRKRQIGNLVAVIVSLGNISPAYGDGVMKYITPVIGDENDAHRNNREKKLGLLFQERSRELKSFTVDDFFQDGKVKVDDHSPSYVMGNGHDNKVKKAIHVFNFLNFMYMIGETTRRLYRDKQGKVASRPHGAQTTDKFYYYGFSNVRISDARPVGSFHARAMKLLKQGDVPFRDVYGNSGVEFKSRPQYGVVSGVNTIRNNDEVDNKCYSVNQLCSNFHQREFIAPAAYEGQLSNQYLLSRSHCLHEELRTQFGGDSESDSDDSSYDSDSDTEYQEFSL